MDVTFFNPPRSRGPTDQVLDTAMLWMASQLADHGCGSAIRMPSGDQLEEQVTENLARDRPRFVAIACKWWNTLFGALEVARAVRCYDRSIPIIMGGHTATVFSSELTRTGLVDVVLTGDVDASLPSLIIDDELQSAVTADGRPHPPRQAANRPNLDGVRLRPPESFVDRPELVPGYIWSGRGCCHPCFYCAENGLSGKLLMGRSGSRFREPQSVALDAQALGERTHLIFDYESPSRRLTEAFLEQFCGSISAGTRSCYYFAWRLPSPRVLTLLSETFLNVQICLDVQVFDEAQRGVLAGHRLVKPFVPDSAIIAVLEEAQSRRNVTIDATGIVGYPLESEENRERGLDFIERVANQFSCVRDWRPSPLHVIPGTPLAREVRFHDLVVQRRDFEDFLAFTEESYRSRIPYYSTARSHHPFGVFPEREPEAIPQFMAKAEERLRSVQASKTSVAITREGASADVLVTDPFSPLRTLIDAFDSEKLTGVRHLRLGLGPRTWFHGSWVDYTSETGENSATVAGAGRDIAGVRRAVLDRLNRFERVSLSSSATRWGVIDHELSLLRSSAVPNGESETLTVGSGRPGL